LVAETGDGYTAFILAGDKIMYKHYQKYGCGLKNKNQSNDLKKQFYIIKNKYGCTTWHRAPTGRSLELLKALCIWSKEDELNRDEIFLTQTVDGFNAFRMAGQNNHIETLKKLWIWAKEMLINPKS